MMKRYIAFVLICSFTISLWAQTFKGRVVDFAGNPIPYAALYLKELKTGFTTDDNGCFQTSLQPGQYTCEVSSLGFAGRFPSPYLPEIWKRISYSRSRYTVCGKSM